MPMKPEKQVLILKDIPIIYYFNSLIKCALAISPL